MEGHVADISELPVPVHRRDAAYYVVLFFFVGPIWSVVPLSWAYFLRGISFGRVLSYSLKGQVLFAAALCEVLFSIYYYALSRRISGPSPNPPSKLSDAQTALTRMLQSGLANLPEDDGDESNYDRPGSPAEPITQLDFDDERAIDFRNRFRTWFGKVPWSHIRRSHLDEWLYWSTYNAPLPAEDNIPRAHRVMLDEATAQIEKRVGCRFPEGSNPNVRPLLLTVDPINVLSRPLGWYIFVKVANICLRKWYEINHDVQYGRFGDLEYLIRIPPGYNRSTGLDPVVFAHGLGLGIFQYQQIISHFLEELPHIPFLIPIQPQISQDFFHPRFLKPMIRHEKVECLTGLLKKLGWVDIAEKKYGVTFLSHSNGSYTHAWMLKAHPGLVKRSCFVDPVTLNGWEGDVCYNFIYRTCTTSVELVIRYIVGTELGVANFLQRHFDSLGNTLWFEEIPNARDPHRSFFLLGGKDCIVDAERIKRYLTNHGAKKGVWYDPKGRHGQALLIGGEGMARVLEWLRDNSGQQ